MNYTEASDAIQKMFWSVFKPASTAILGYTPKVYWPDSVEPASAATDKVWMRVSRRDLPETLAGFAEGENQSVKRYDVPATLFIQFFYPQSDGSANTKLSQLAQVAKDALQGKHDPTNVLWTRDCSIVSLNPELTWFRKNVVVDFTYQEIKR